jgi:hypothetical protein
MYDLSSLHLYINIFLAVINNFHFIDSFSTCVALAYVITALIIIQYNFNLVFFKINSFLNIFLLTQEASLPRAILSLISSSMELYQFQIDPRYLQDFTCSKS